MATIIRSTVVQHDTETDMNRTPDTITQVDSSSMSLDTDNEVKNVTETSVTERVIAEDTTTQVNLETTDETLSSTKMELMLSLCEATGIEFEIAQSLLQVEAFNFPC